MVLGGSRSAKLQMCTGSEALYKRCHSSIMVLSMIHVATSFKLVTPSVPYVAICPSFQSQPDETCKRHAKNPHAFDAIRTAH